VAPALHSLIIRERENVVCIVETPSDGHVFLTKLILKRCQFGEDGPGILNSIVTLYPDLEVLSLEDCCQLTSADYCLISHMKNLSELNLSRCQVHYVCVKLLGTYVCICEHM
jgi:hypothetical protein